MSLVVLAEVVVVIASLNPGPLILAKGDDRSLLDVLQHAPENGFLIRGQ